LYFIRAGKGGALEGIWNNLYFIGLKTKVNHEQKGGIARMLIEENSKNEIGPIE